MELAPDQHWKQTLEAPDTVGMVVTIDIPGLCSKVSILTLNFLYNDSIWKVNEP